MAAESFDQEELGTIAAINITPFVDVVLVLLVIFMVTAPAMMKDIIGIQLPKSVSSDQKSPSSIGVAVNREGQILVDGRQAAFDAVTSQIQAALALDPQTQIIISADQEARHGDVVKAVDLVKSAGATRFAFQIQKP